jgi:hypothetical protein
MGRKRALRRCDRAGSSAREVSDFLRSQAPLSAVRGFLVAKWRSKPDVRCARLGYRIQPLLHVAAASPTSTRTHPARSSGSASDPDISTVPSAATFRRSPESS